MNARSFDAHEQWLRVVLDDAGHCEGLRFFSAALEILGEPACCGGQLVQVKSGTPWSCGECNECRINGWKRNAHWQLPKMQQLFWK